jgi:N-methylhydantoinase B
LGGEKVKLITFGEGDVEPPFGAQGGKPGTLNKIELQYPEGRVYRTTTKDLVDDVPAGTIYYQEAGGGGGYGDPRKRPADQVRKEVRNSIISVKSAKEDYGVVLDPETFAVDMEGTKALRGVKSDKKK